VALNSRQMQAKLCLIPCSCSRGREGGQRWKGDEGCGDRAERAHAHSLGEAGEDEYAESAKGERSSLIDAAGFAASRFVAKGTHHSAATGDDQLAKTRTEKHECDRCRGIEPVAVEGRRQGERRADGSDHKPGAAAYPEVGDRAPEEVDGLGKDEQRDDLGASSDADALPAEQIREDPSNYAVGEDCIRRDEKAEEPRTLFCGGKSWACELLQGDVAHGTDISMSSPFSMP
jgi:hypothetical protein